MNKHTNLTSPNIEIVPERKRKTRWILIILGLLLVTYLLIYIFPSPKRESKPFFAGDRPLVIAHQGGEHLAPSNTMVAFQQAYNMGVDVLEFDIHMTKDGHLVIIHDDTVDRTTDGTGRVDELTIREIKQLDAGHYFKDLNDNHSFRGKGVQIPTVEEVFKQFTDIRFLIEIKDSYPKDGESQIEEKLWNLIKKYNYEDRVLVASFDQKILERFNQFAQDTIAIGGGKGEVVKFVVFHKFFLNGLYRPAADSLQVPMKEAGFNLTDRKLLKGAHKRNMVIYYWTINNEEDMRFLIEQGADGIITDRPDLLLKVISEFN